MRLSQMMCNLSIQVRALMNKDIIKDDIQVKHDSNQCNQLT